MEPFCADYAGDRDEQSSGAASPNERSSCPVAEDLVVSAVLGAAAIVGEICDAFGLLPGARWMDGGP